MVVRKTREDEVEKVVELINKVFREERGGLPHTMEKEFPLLLTEENSENMRIIENQGRICSVVNFLPREISIEGASISVGSIGAVCTASAYRGRGHSTRILADVEERMKRVGINLCLVSGTRNLYKKWGAERVKSCIKYKISSEDMILKYSIREYREEDLSTIKKIYNSKSNRYLRNSKDFEILIDSGTFPFGTTSYMRYVMEDEEKVIGYIILKKTPDGIEVKEAGGHMTEIFQSLTYLGNKMKVEEIDYYLPHGESAPAGYRGANDYLQGSIKIIDPRGLMKELKPYFYQYVDEGLADSFKVEEKEEGYMLKLENESIEVASHSELLKLIFEEREMEYEKNQERIGEFIDLVFPIPFPWTENLNYQ